jgi:hypothetical protein
MTVEEKTKEEKTMNIPNFTAEASLYRTKLSYRGAGGRPVGPGVAAQSLGCSFKCILQNAACLLASAESGGPITSAACEVVFAICESDCGGGAGGVGGRHFPPHCGCGPDKKCCGNCVHQPGIIFCDGECIGLHETCVTVG